MDKNSSGGRRLWLTDHFKLRVRERVGAHVNAFSLAHHVLEGLDSGDTVYIGRVNRNGMRCFRFLDFDQRTFYVLIDTEKNALVTVLPPGFTLGKQNGSSITLQDSDL